MAEFNKIIGNAIKLLREELGMTQAQLAKGKKITPEKLLPFPWDKKKAAAAKKAKEYTPEQQRRRMEELVKKLGDSLQ